MSACGGLRPQAIVLDLDAVQSLADETISASRARGGLLCPTATEPRAGESTSLASEPSQGGEPAAAGGPVADSLGPPLSRLQSLEVLVRDQPGNVDLYLELARLYLARGRDYEAERLLARGRTATERDPRLEEFAEDVTMLRLAKKVSAGQKDADANDTPAAREALASLVRERDRVEIEIYLERCRRNPTELALRLELGRRLARAGQLDQACERFEEALPDAQTRHAAALELGDCCEQMQRRADACRYYRVAADGPAPPEALDCQSEALLRASRLALGLKLSKVARRYAAWLLQLDPRHQGAAALVERLDREQT